MRRDGKLGGAAHLAALALHVMREWSFFHPPVNSSLFESFESGRLGMGQARLGAALGKNPTPFASLHQQELDALPAHAEADRCYFLAAAQLAQVRQPQKLAGRIRDLRSNDSGRRSSAHS